MVDLTPRRECVCTRHPQRQRATRGVLTSHPTKLAKIGMHVKKLSDWRHRHFLACLDGLRRELVKENKSILDMSVRLLNGL